MRLKKSGIECVILAGSSHFAISAQWAKARLAVKCGRNCHPQARAARDFFKDFGFMAPENPIFFWPAGAYGLPMGRFLASLEPNPCPGS